MVAPTLGVRLDVRVSGFHDDSGPGGSKTTEPSEKPTGSPGVAEETEVVAEHDDRIELAKATSDVRKGQDPGMANTT
jgi:hypothetical protein